MPELPEVEVVRAGLAPAVEGAAIERVTVFDERSLRRHVGPSEDFVHRLGGRRMLVPERRGKFLWIPLAARDAGTEPHEVLMVHLGMSGQVLLRDREADDRLTRIRLDIASEVKGALRLNFVDQRIFGSMAIDHLVVAADGLGRRVPSQVSHIARDPLDEHFDDRRFLARLAARRTGVKRALLDQSLISGIGNIYADEALWAARIHYDEATDSLSRPRAKRLLRRGAARAREGAGRGWHELRRAVPQCQWRVGVLRALAQRLRPARSPVPALRPGDRARAVHESRLTLLPVLPTSSHHAG
jgi:formamidopyrimidine-DNA glycosylase